MKAIEITFQNGRDVLKAYWGFLANGGLVVSEAQGRELVVGDRVALTVVIASSGKEYQLRGHVVRRPDVTQPEGTIIEFSPGEPHDLLLSAAWAETDNTPVRKHHRHGAQRDVGVRIGSETLSGRLLNVSLGGCCVNLLGGVDGKLRAGDHVVVTAGGNLANGRVRWKRADDIGVQFEDGGNDSDTVARFVRRFIASE